MRIERIVVERFGRLRGLDTGETPLPSLVAVVGPNEAGKTTLFSFLGCILYGFYPATRDRHPYTPWSGEDIEGRAVLRMEGGEVWEVHRRLLSSPGGRLVRGGTETTLRNDTLPCTGQVGREVFGQAFALTLAELAGLDGRGWEQIQDRLVGGMGSTDLRPVREVCEALEEEAGRLWRPNRRGNQEVREARERIAGLRTTRREALEQDREIRTLARDAEEVEGRLEELREERVRRTAVLKQMTVLAPIREKLRRIDGFEEDAGPVEELLDLPADPESRLEELDERVSDFELRIEEAEDRAEELEERVDAFEPALRRLDEEREAIRTLVADAGTLDSDLTRLRTVEQEIRDLDRRGEAIARDLLDSEWREIDPAAVTAVRTGELRDQLRVYLDARRDHQTIREAVNLLHLGADRTAPRPTFFPLGAGTLAIGVVLLVVALSWERSGVAVAGAGLLVLGAVLLLLGRRDRGVHEREGARVRQREEEIRERLRATSLEERQAREDVLELLDPLPLRTGLVEAPTAELAAQVQLLQDLLRDRVEREEERERLASRLEELEERVRTLGRRLDMELPKEPRAATLLLRQRLEEAEATARDAETAQRELERLRRGLERDRELRARSGEERRRLVATLERIGGGDRTRGLERAAVRLRARERAAELRAELEQEHPKLDEIRERVREAEERGEEWTIDERVIGESEARLDEIRREIEELAPKLSKLRTTIEHLREGLTVDQVDGEIAALEERVREAGTERDRLWLLSRLAREADRRFREEHQPDLLRRAGEHLETITGGRYRRFLLSDGERGAGFSLRGGERAEPVRLAEPLSTGTREQAYLALRLAIVDHLDHEGERLPLFVDEAFVNWDPRRRGRGFDLLAELAERRQVFLFTCHPDTARELEERGAGLVTLESP